MVLLQATDLICWRFVLKVGLTCGSQLYVMDANYAFLS